MPNRIKIYTTKMFEDDLKKINSDITVVGECTSYRENVLVKHICGYEWEVKPDNIIRRHTGCPKCNHKSSKKSQAEFEKEIYDLDDDIEVIGEYRGINEKVMIRRKSCGHEYNIIPHESYRGFNCPYCSSKILLVGFNDIATTAPWMVEYLADKEDAHRYMRRSAKKIKFICPYCGTEDVKKIQNVYRSGYTCSVCSIGVSFPNRLSRAVIRQLPVENIIMEYSPEWAGGKRYDNYFEFNGNKYIIEMDGSFHYKDTDMTNLSEVIRIDKLKDEMALNHNITMIRIDCKKSEYNYIKNNILNSKLNEIFDLNIINWDLCLKESTPNIIKNICEYYNINKSNITIDEIAEHFNISDTTFRKYRDIGVKYGWCDYDKDIVENVRVNKIAESKYKAVSVFDEMHSLIKSFLNAKLCCEYMNNNLDEHFNITSIRRSCVNGNKYNGYYFKYSNK